MSVSVTGAEKGDIRVLVLGAGQDVGKSCIVVSFPNPRFGDGDAKRWVTVMFDCGVHMAISDRRRLPDFEYMAHTLGRGKTADELIDCVCISHFHLDHVGALPYFTQVLGYSKTVLATQPTIAMGALLLRDYSRITRTKHLDLQLFTEEHIGKCMEAVRSVRLKETTRVGQLEVRCFYAGHVLGAVMFEVKLGEMSVLYTGDYNMTADRHLGAARVCERLRPDLLISEATYASMVRESRRIREANLCAKVHECLRRGGKVLVPVFALGRAQQMMHLLESYWQAHDDLRGSVPLLSSSGLSQYANDYYALYEDWQKEGSALRLSLFKQWIPAVHQSATGPCVLLATSAMLEAGLSLRMFKHWCVDANNLVVLPAFCHPSTTAGQLLAGAKTLRIGSVDYRVQIAVANLSFSAHADAKGIMALVSQCAPKNAMLVHGVAKKMRSLKRKIEAELGVATVCPKNKDLLWFQKWQPAERSAADSSWLRSALLSTADLRKGKSLLAKSTVEFALKTDCMKHDESVKCDLQWISDSLQRNLNSHWKVEGAEECVRIFASDCRSPKSPFAATIQLSIASADSVQMVYTNKLVEIAALVQSLLVRVCDSCH